jgi:hypothetical protein
LTNIVSYGVNAWYNGLIVAKITFFISSYKIL